MVHRRVEPGVERRTTPAGRGRTPPGEGRRHRAPAAGARRSPAPRAVRGPGRRAPAEAPGRADRRAGSQLGSDVVAVTGPIGEQAEHRPLVEGERRPAFHALRMPARRSPLGSLLLVSRCTVTTGRTHANAPGRGRAGSRGLLLAACGDDGGDTASDATETTGGATTTAPASELEGSITVFAAASLTDAFTEIGTEFEAANPGVTVEFNFAASSALREQILEGAPADVFASANTSNMDQVVEGGEADDPATFVENELRDRRPGRQRGRRDRPRRLRRRRPADRAVRRGGPVRASSAARRWPTPGSHRRSTRTSPTCAPCSPRSRPTSSMPGSSTVPTCSRPATPSRASRSRRRTT